MCVTCMTCSHVWNDSLHRHCQHYSLSSCIYVRWPIHVCDMTHSYVWHESSKNVTWLIQKCDMSVSFHRAALSLRSSPSSTSTCSTPRVETLKSQLDLNFLKNGTADNFWEILICSSLWLSLPLFSWKYVCAYGYVCIHCLYLCVHQCSKINQIWIWICIYIYMHQYWVMPTDELYFIKHRQSSCSIHIYAYTCIQICTYICIYIYKHRHVLCHG